MVLEDLPSVCMHVLYQYENDVMCAVYVNFVCFGDVLYACVCV